MINPPFSTHQPHGMMSGTAYADMGTLSHKIPTNILNSFESPHNNKDSPSADNKNSPLTAKQKFNLRFPHLNIQFYTDLTNYILQHVYPKHCSKCQTLMTKHISTRENVIRCSKCHYISSKTVNTPLHHLKVPLWVFSYLIHQSLELYPNVLSSASIQRRLQVTENTALLLKRRLQLFYGDLKPAVRNLLLEEIAEKPLNMDACVLFSCSMRANGFRKRYKQKGMTSSLYVSSKVAEEKGKYQIGVMAHVMAVKSGAVLMDSIPDNKQTTIRPLFDFIPAKSEIHTDEGYPWMSSFYDNAKAVNHSARGKHGRYARDRWCKENVHCQVAEGLHRNTKHSFISGYSYITPEFSPLYLDEYSVIKSIRSYMKDRVGDRVHVLAKFVKFMMDCVKSKEEISNQGKRVRFDRYLQHEIKKRKYTPPTPFERGHGNFSQTRKLIPKDLKDILLDPDMFSLNQAYWHYQEYFVDGDKNRKQSEVKYGALAKEVFGSLYRDEYNSINCLIKWREFPRLEVYRILSRWHRTGIADVQEHILIKKGRKYRDFLVKPLIDKMIPILYTLDRHTYINSYSKMNHDNIFKQVIERDDPDFKTGMKKSERKDILNKLKKGA